MRRSVAALLVGIGLAACGDDEAPPPPSLAPKAEECTAGFAPDARGFCLETVTTDACGPGTRPKIGSTRCEPVGWTTSCPAGLTKDPSGWGCVDARVSPCLNETRESASSGKCVPVGDCSAAFPPAGAIVVDAAFTDAQLDATHFRTIADAVAGAPAGATVAVMPGTYAESVAIGKAVTLAGKCPGQVKITPPLSNTVKAGISVTTGATAVTIRGLTVSGPHAGGIEVYTGSEATIEEVVVDGAKLWGVIVDDSLATIKRSKISGTILGPDASGKDVKGGWGIAAGHSSVTIDDVAIVGGTDALFAGTTDAEISASRLVVTGQAPQPPSRANGVYSRGGRITLERSVFHDITGDAAVSAELPKGIVEVRDSVLRDIKVVGSTRGYGAVAFGGGEVSLRNVSVIGAESVGLVVRDSGSVLSAYDTVVRGPAQSFAQPDEDLIVTSVRAGIGVQADGKAKLNLDGVAIIESWGWAAYGAAGAVIDMKHTLIDGTRPLEPKRSPALPFAVGISVAGATATVEDVTVLRTMLSAVTAGKEGVVSGRGLYVRDVTATDPVGTGAGIAVGDGGRADLEASAIVDSTTSGVLATHGDAASVRLAGSTVHGTRAAPQGFGHGVVVAAEAEVLLERTAVFENAAIGIAANGGRARLVSSVIARNPVAMHVQGGSFLVESAAEDDLGATEVRVSPDSRFLDNASRLGSGEIPLPSNVLP